MARGTTRSWSTKPKTLNREKEGENVAGEEAPADEATETTEPAESSSKQPETKDKSAHARMSKLFSFGKKEKTAEEKPLEAEAKAEETPAEAVQPTGVESLKGEGDLPSDETKKAEEPEGEKKEESNFSTNIRKLFTIGKKNKDQHEDKKVDDANEEEAAAT